MSMKRKFSPELEDQVAYSTAKRPNLFAFPSTSSTAELDTDVAMSDSSSDGFLTPLSFGQPQQQFHSRLPSNASTTSSQACSPLENSPSSSPFYPDFILYPTTEQDIANNFNSPTTNSPKSVGLMQPKGNTFTHHGQSCTQIPKLRMSCAPGLNGHRTMWAHCEECGAIEMVDFD